MLCLCLLFSHRFLLHWRCGRTPVAQHSAHSATQQSGDVIRWSHPHYQICGVIACSMSCHAFVVCVSTQLCTRRSVRMTRKTSVLLLLCEACNSARYWRDRFSMTRTMVHIASVHCICVFPASQDGAQLQGLGTAGAHASAASEDQPSAVRRVRKSMGEVLSKLCGAPEEPVAYPKNGNAAKVRPCTLDSCPAYEQTQQQTRSCCCLAVCSWQRRQRVRGVYSRPMDSVNCSIVGYCHDISVA